MCGEPHGHPEWSKATGEARKHGSSLTNGRQGRSKGAGEPDPDDASP